MGMFDYVEYKADCPNCGTEMTEWQTKDLDCTLATVQPKDVKYFYEFCPICKFWVEASMEQSKELTITLKATKEGEEAT